MALRHKSATQPWQIANSNLKAILFDMDGTLVQLDPIGRQRVLNETLADFGLPYRVTMAQTDRFWFTSERYSMIDSWGIERRTFWQAFDCERLLMLQMEHTYAFEDVGEVLTYLHSRDLRLGVVSNSAHVSLAHKLDLLHSHIQKDHFEVVVSCNDDVPKTKPFKDGLDLALLKMGLAPAEVILVGDSLDDIGAGAAAGVPVAVVDRGQLATIYEKHGSDRRSHDFIILESLRQLPAALGLHNPAAVPIRAA